MHALAFLNCQASICSWLEVQNFAYTMLNSEYSVQAYISVKYFWFKWCSVSAGISMQEQLVIYDNEKGRLAWMPSPCDKMPKSKAAIISRIWNPEWSCQYLMGWKIEEGEEENKEKLRIVRKELYKQETCVCTSWSLINAHNKAYLKIMFVFRLRWFFSFLQTHLRCSLCCHKFDCAVHIYASFIKKETIPSMLCFTWVASRNDWNCNCRHGIWLSWER